MKQFLSFTSISSLIGITAAMLFLGVSGQQLQEDPIGTKNGCTPTSCPYPQICVSQPDPCIQGSCPQPSHCECPKRNCHTVKCVSGRKCVVQPPPGCPRGPQPPPHQCCPVPQCVPVIFWRTLP